MASSRTYVNTGSTISLFGLVAAVIGGSVWTGAAVVDGDMAATTARFIVSIGVGLFYLLLVRAASPGS